MKGIGALLKALTLEEKASLIIGAGNWTTAAVPRLGIPSLFLADGPHGVRRVVDEQGLGIPGLPATCFPTASCLASTWDTALVEELGRALGGEAKALRVDVLLGPGVNVRRTPLGGRNFEYFSEDPCLAGELAAAFIRGVQSRGVGTSLKHYAANNQEYERFTVDAVVDERALREIYLAAFETAVKKGAPRTVMAAYNRVNGVRACEHAALIDGVLRREWGFDGVVVSDWGAVKDRVVSLKAGLDLEMPGPRKDRRRAVVRAVKSGALPPRVLDRAVRRVLRLAAACAATSKGGATDWEAHHSLARRIAGEGFVLLKNEGVLPLGDPVRVAVIGRSAPEPYVQGGGSSRVAARRVDVPLDEIRARAGGAEVSFCEGYPAGPVIDQRLVDEAAELARRAEVALVFIALDEFVESESCDRTTTDLPANRVALIKAVCAAQPRTAVILGNGGVVTMEEWIDGAPAVLETWMAGEAGAGAIADALWGDVNPSGKLPETVPLRLADTPAFINYPGENGRVRYGEGLFVGYRYYDYRGAPVRFPFGHGLSYTTFEYGRLSFSETSFKDADGLTVSFEIANTGTRAGRETAQVYVRDVRASLARPVKELKAFVKTALEPGERKAISVHLDFRAFAFYHPGLGRWVAESGEFEILVGSSAADIRLRGAVRLRSTAGEPSLLAPGSSVRLWLDDERGGPLVRPLVEKIEAALSKEGGGGMLGFILESPLERLLRQWEEPLALNADETMADIMRRLHGKFSAPKQPRRPGGHGGGKGNNKEARKPGKRNLGKGIQEKK
ncbi:MAG: glycoside hydrolase family 3 C-terminal domain-containing protein [Spirochaetales bacterium]|nr:glycoside hydrolase family 3 C-terminal domain-containing protein [Spirochaetales bacterium]